MHYSVNMNDANGGASTLRGLVPNVPLTCGSVVTHANVYIGDQVPFDLLLGRPWQRGNFVSIDEREDGTYLLFKDAELNVRHELLVTPEPANLVQPDIADFISKAQKAKQVVNTITIQNGSDANETQDIEMSFDDAQPLTLPPTETSDSTLQVSSQLHLVNSPPNPVASPSETYSLGSKSSPKSLQDHPSITPINSEKPKRDFDSQCQRILSVSKHQVQSFENRNGLPLW